MDVRKLRNIVELLDEFDVAEFRLKDTETSLNIVRKRAITVQPQTLPQQTAPQSTLEENQSNKQEETPVSFANKNQTNLGDTNQQQYNDEKVIQSPMVGTFYTAPSPDSDDFILVGSTIEAGDPVCIIEAMKIMNRIESDKTGVVKEILVKSGHPVQYGQPLIILE